MTRTSMVFATVRAVFDELSLVGWPLSSANPAGVTVLLGSAPAGDPLAESVTVVPVVDESVQRWATLGRPGRDEVFGVRVVVDVATPMPAADVWSRLEELAAVVEEAFRSMTTGRPSIPADVDLIANGGAGVWNMQLVAVRPQLEAAAEGHVGSCEIDIACTARI